MVIFKVLEKGYWNAPRFTGILIKGSNVESNVISWSLDFWRIVFEIEYFRVLMTSKNIEGGYYVVLGRHKFVEFREWDLHIRIFSFESLISFYFLMLTFFEVIVLNGEMDLNMKRILIMDFRLIFCNTCLAFYRVKVFMISRRYSSITFPSVFCTIFQGHDSWFPVVKIKVNINRVLNMLQRGDSFDLDVSFSPSFANPTIWAR